MKKDAQKNVIFRGLFFAFAFVGAATVIGRLFCLLQFPETNIVVVYILSVILTARFTDGYIWGIAATVLSTCAFNIFFTHPYFTLFVDDPTYLITFAIMAMTSVITSALTSKAKKMTAEAIRNGEESGALYYLTGHLADAKSTDEIAGITAETVSRIMDCKAAFLCFDDRGNPERTFIQQKTASEQIRRCLSDPDEIRHRMEDLRTDHDVGEEFYDWPIRKSESILGVLRIPKERAVTLTDHQKKLLRSMIESTALAMEGDGMEPDILKAANIRRADTVIAVTNNDNINIMIAQIAIECFSVKHIISRLYDPERECVYRELGIDTICPAVLSVNEIDRILSRNAELREEEKK